MKEYIFKLVLGPNLQEPDMVNSPGGTRRRRSRIPSEEDDQLINFLGAKYLGFFSSHSLKTREKYISFAQLVLLSLYIF